MLAEIIGIRVFISGIQCFLVLVFEVVGLFQVSFLEFRMFWVFGWSGIRFFQFRGFFCFLDVIFVRDFWFLFWVVYICSYFLGVSTFFLLVSVFGLRGRGGYILLCFRDRRFGGVCVFVKSCCGRVVYSAGKEIGKSRM